MAVALLQSATAASNAASPVSVTPTLGGGSTAGNLLLLIVVATGTNPTVTAPGGNWTQLQNLNNASIAMGVFSQVNNAGGITSQAVTVSATGGGAAAAIFEFSGMGNGALDLQTARLAGAASNTVATASLLNQIPVGSVGELLFAGFAFAAQTITPALSSQFGTAVGAVVSTNGTPNAQLSCYWGIAGPGEMTSIGCTFGGSVFNAEFAGRWTTLTSNPLTRDNIGGNAGVLVGNFYQGMIGGD